MLGRPPSGDTETGTLENRAKQRFSLEFHECQLFPKWNLFYATYIRSIVWSLAKYFLRNILDVGLCLVCPPLYAQPAVSLAKSQI